MEQSPSESRRFFQFYYGPAFFPICPPTPASDRLTVLDLGINWERRSPVAQGTMAWINPRRAPSLGSGAGAIILPSHDHQADRVNTLVLGL